MNATDLVAREGRALSLRSLTVGVRDGPAIVEDVDLDLAPGEILGLVGESGSGKTTLGLALLGHCGPGTEIRAGSLQIGGVAMRMDESMRSIRGSAIAYVPQDPGQALNPALRISTAIEDVIRVHRRSIPDGMVAGLLEMVHLPSSEEFMRRYPHQLSGGQTQRVSIAMALASHPQVVVLDEPTTGLDVETQRRILEELAQLREGNEVSMVYVTHDLAVVAEIADRIAVMYAGRIVELGPAAAVLERPRHPYTRGLLASIPDHLRPRALEPMPGIAVAIGERPRGCSFAVRCRQRTDECTRSLPSLTEIVNGHEVRCIHWETTPAVSRVSMSDSASAEGQRAEMVLEVEHLKAEHRSHKGRVIAAEDVSFAIPRGECVALVGESGSGKTTIARAIAGLHPAAAGRILLSGQQLADDARRRSVSERRRVQLIVQNPKSALNPRHTVRRSIARPIRVLREASISRKELDGEVMRLLERVRLPTRVANCYPYELSGGEVQRVAIARALAAEPELVVCDEITSALDVSVQAAVLKLLGELQADFRLSLLFITHNLGVVATVADEVLVLERGLICERGDTATVLQNPRHAYTRRLIAAAPSVEGPTAPAGGEAGSGGARLFREAAKAHPSLP